MPGHIRDLLASKDIPQVEMSSLEEAVVDADVVYVTRIQKERFASEEEYERLRNVFVVTPELMARAKRKMAVMHPLPRVNEIRWEFRLVDNYQLR